MLITAQSKGGGGLRGGEKDGFVQFRSELGGRDVGSFVWDWLAFEYKREVLLPCFGLRGLGFRKRRLAGDGVQASNPTACESRHVYRRVALLQFPV